MGHWGSKQLKTKHFKWLGVVVLLGGFSLQSFAHDEEMLDLLEDKVERKTCIKANAKQLSLIQSGNAKKDLFLQQCAEAGVTSDLCQQLTRPNLNSKSTFTCTYGNEVPHQLIDPDESTWEFAFQGAKIVMELQKNGVSVDNIYNWWRPEPYNKNVGGVPIRHPEGTSIDVRMSNITHASKALSLLCKWRNNKTDFKALNALGYYGNTGIHFGVADTLENTWGNPCSSKK